MAQPTLTDLPSALVAGDSLILEQSWSDYQAPTWVLTFVLRCKDNTQADTITWTFSDGGSGLHRITITSTDSISYTPGDYYVVGFVTSGTSRVKVFDGYISIKADYATAGTDVELRTYSERVLENLRDAMETLSTATAENVSVEGVSYSRRNMSALQAMIDVYQARVDAERVSTTQNEGRYQRRVVVRFTTPT